MTEKLKKSLSRHLLSQLNDFMSMATKAVLICTVNNAHEASNDSLTYPRIVRNEI